MFKLEQRSTANEIITSAKRFSLQSPRNPIVQVFNLIS